MKITHRMTSGALLTLLLTVSATAQNVVRPQQTGYDYDYYAYSAQEQPATPTAPPAATPEPATPPAMACDSGCENIGCNACCEEPCRWCRDGALADPWTLPQPAFLKDRNVTIGGWIEGGIYSNQYGAPSNGPIGFRNVGDGATADQLWIFGERKTNTEESDWDVGGRVDYVFGADGPDTQAFGDRTWDYGWNSSRDYGSAIPQLYAEIAYRDLSIKLGRFWTLIGYEVVPATGNFFYSHSYSMYYAEPFTHTGALATYKYNDVVTLYGGWVNGWDEGFDTANNGSQFMGGVGLTLSERATLTWALTAGEIGDGSAFPGAANGDVYMNSIVFNYAINDNWTYVFQNDVGSNYNNGTDNNQWYGISNYLFRKLNDCLSVGARIEWFQDPQGARVIAGNRGNYYELTAGMNWKPHSNFILRPEIRYDWYDGTTGVNGEAFDNGTANNQVSGGLDAIFTY